MNIVIHRDGKNLGPYTLDEIKHRLATGDLVLTDLAFVEGTTEWTTLQLVPGVVAHPPPLSAATPQPSALPPLQTGVQSRAATAKVPIWKRKSCLGCLGLFIAGIIFWIILLAIWHPKNPGDFDDTASSPHATWHDPLIGAPAIYWVFAALATIPFFVLTFRAMTRISMIPGEPPRFEGRWANRSVNWFTGYVNGSATRSDTSVSGSIQTSSGGTVTGNISSATRVTDAFRLVNPKTQQESNFQLSGYHLQVWEHQLVSVAWVIRKGKESGPHFVVINHTTGDQFSNDRVLWRIFYPHADLAFVLMVLLCLPFPFVLLLSFAWGFAMRAEFARLMRTGIQPLREFLNQKARELA